VRPRQNTVVQPAAVRALREGRGWTHEQMADAVHASPLEVAAWEVGTVSVPERQDAWIRRQAALDARAAAVAAADLPACGWAVEHAPTLHADLCLDPHALLAGPLRLHVRACDACRQVRTFARTLPRLPKDPDAPFETTPQVFRRLLDLLPKDAQNVITILGGTIAVVAGAWLTDTLLEDVEAKPWLLFLILIAARVFGGIVFDALERPLARALWRHPSVAELLQWTAGIAAGLCVWLSAIALPDTARWAIPAGLALTFVLATLRMLDGGREQEPESQVAAVDPDDDAGSRSTEANDAPPAPAVLLAAPDPLAALDEVRDRPRAQHAGAPGREGA